MKKAIFVCDQAQKFRSVFPEQIVAKLREMTDLDETLYSKEDVLACPEKFRSAELLFSTWGMPSFSEAEIRDCFPSLECVFYAAGSVQKFARPFLSSGVKVFSAWAANGVPVAEYTVAQIVLAGKGFFAHTRLMQKERTKEAKALTKRYPGNYGENIGLIGCGMIGSMVAERLKDYELGVLVYDPFLSTEKAKRLNVITVSLDELFRTCRVISNHLANNEQTKGILNYGHFSSMLPYATFLNTGRGAQVVEDDLVRALRERPDLTAVLDVTFPEPPVPSHPFYSLENCFLTPHVAGSLGNEVVRMAEYMCEEAHCYLAAEPCLYEVSEKMLETMA